MPACTLSRFSRVWLFVTTRTAAHQTPLPMGFSRQEYWSGFPCPLPEDLPNPGVESALVGWFFTTSATWEIPTKHGTILSDTAQFIFLKIAVPVIPVWEMLCTTTTLYISLAFKSACQRLRSNTVQKWVLSVRVQHFPIFLHFTCLFLTVLGLHCCTGFSADAGGGAGGILSSCGFRLLIVVASLSTEHGL